MWIGKLNAEVLLQTIQLLSGFGMLFGKLLEVPLQLLDLRPQASEFAPQLLNRLVWHARCRWDEVRRRLAGCAWGTRSRSGRRAAFHRLRRDGLRSHLALHGGKLCRWIEVMRNDLPTALRCESKQKSFLLKALDERLQGRNVREALFHPRGSTTQVAHALRATQHQLGQHGHLGRSDAEPRVSIVLVLGRSTRIEHLDHGPTLAELLQRVLDLRLIEIHRRMPVALLIAA